MDILLPTRTTHLEQGAGHGELLLLHHLEHQVGQLAKGTVHDLGGKERGVAVK